MSIKKEIFVALYHNSYSKNVFCRAIIFEFKDGVPRLDYYIRSASTQIEWDLPIYSAHSCETNLEIIRFNGWATGAESVNYVNQIGVCPNCFCMQTNTAFDDETINGWLKAISIAEYIQDYRHIMFAPPSHRKFYKKPKETDADLYELCKSIKAFHSPFVRSNSCYWNSKSFACHNISIGIERLKRMMQQLGLTEPIPETITAQPEKAKTKTTSSELGGVYCLRIGKFVKVGMSASSPEKRAAAQMIPGMSIDWVLPHQKPRDAEIKAHTFLASVGKRSGKTEWFEYDGSTEKVKNYLTT